MPDYTELKTLCVGDVVLNRREHQVMAMYAYGFNDDRIIADYLDIKLKYVQAIKHQLRRRFGVTSCLALARIYESVVRLPL